MVEGKFVSRTESTAWRISLSSAITFFISRMIMMVAHDDRPTHHHVTAGIPMYDVCTS